MTENNHSIVTNENNNSNVYSKHHPHSMCDLQMLSNTLKDCKRLNTKRQASDFCFGL